MYHDYIYSICDNHLFSFLLKTEEFPIECNRVRSKKSSFKEVLFQILFELVGYPLF